VATQDDVIRLVRSDRPMTVPELRQAASALGEGPRDVDVLAARLRVAFRLEALGA
jgi:hypothetical protein